MNLIFMISLATSGEMLSDLIRVQRSLKTLEFDYKLPNVWILSPTNLRSVTLLD